MPRRYPLLLGSLAVVVGLVGSGGCGLVGDASEDAEAMLFYGELDLASATVIVEPGRDRAGGLHGSYVIPATDIGGVLPDRQAFFAYDDGPTAWSSFWYPVYREFNCEATVAVRRVGAVARDDAEVRLLSEADRETVLDGSAFLAGVSVECRDPDVTPPQAPIPPHWVCEEQLDGFTHCTDPTDDACQLNVYVIHPDGQTVDHPEGCIGSGL